LFIEALKNGGLEFATAKLFIGQNALLFCLIHHRPADPLVIRVKIRFKQ